MAKLLKKMKYYPCTLSYKTLGWNFCRTASTWKVDVTARLVRIHLSKRISRATFRHKSVHLNRDTPFKSWKTLSWCRVAISHILKYELYVKFLAMKRAHVKIIREFIVFVFRQNINRTIFEITIYKFLYTTTFYILFN